MRAEARCEYCRAPEEVFNFAFEVEHLMPQSQGGSDDLDNLALACHACNCYKSNFVVGVDPVSGEEAALFNPRVRDGSEHFPELDSDEIIGKTTMRRAMVARLRMNRPRQPNASVVGCSLISSRDHDCVSLLRNIPFLPGAGGPAFTPSRLFRCGRSVAPGDVFRLGDAVSNAYDRTLVQAAGPGSRR